MQKEAKINGRYKNIKTGKVYIVLYNAFASWDSYQNLVVYQIEDKDADDRIWVRAFHEFYEKFESLD